jgi:hypothetical protein
MSLSKVVRINANYGEHAKCDHPNQQTKSKSVTHGFLLKFLTSKTVLQGVVKKL